MANPSPTPPTPSALPPQPGGPARAALGAIVTALSLALIGYALIASLRPAPQPGAPVSEVRLAPPASWSSTPTWRAPAQTRPEAPQPSPTASTTAPSESQAAPAAQPATPSRLININTATVAELQMLPRIGPALAQRIADDRAANGPFTTLDDLDRVSGIGEKTIARLRPYATVSQ